MESYRRVSKRLRALVGTRTRTLDSRLWRTFDDDSESRSALLLHPAIQNIAFLRYIDTFQEVEVHCGDRWFSDKFKLSDLNEICNESATRPSCKSIILDSWCIHACRGAQEVDEETPPVEQDAEDAESEGQDELDENGVAEDMDEGSDQDEEQKEETKEEKVTFELEEGLGPSKCIVPLHIKSKEGVVTVGQFVKGFLRSVATCCNKYQGTDEDTIGELLVFAGWDRQGMDRNTRIARFTYPLWEPV